MAWTGRRADEAVHMPEGLLHQIELHGTWQWLQLEQPGRGRRERQVQARGGQNGRRPGMGVDGAAAGFDHGLGLAKPGYALDACRIDAEMSMAPVASQRL